MPRRPRARIRARYGWSRSAGEGRKGTGNGAPSARERRHELRAINRRLVQDLVHSTGLTHAQVNRQLGLRRVDEATIDRLARGAREAEQWLARH